MTVGEAENAPNADGRRPDRIRSSLISTGLANGLNGGLGVLSGIATARAMAPGARGTLAGLMVWTATMTFFAVWGSDDSLIYMSGGDGQLARQYRVGSRKAVRRQALLASVVLAFVLWRLAHDSGQGVVVVIPLLLLVAELGIYTTRAAAVLRAAGKLSAWNVLRLCPSGLYALTVLIAYRVGHVTIIVVVSCYTFAMLATSLVARLLVDQVIPCRLKYRVITKRGETLMIRYGLKITLANLPYTANQRLDQLVLALVAAPRELGMYSVAVSLAGVQQLAAITCEQALFPILVGRSTSSFPSARKAVLAALALGAATAIPCIIFAPNLVSAFFGRAYLGGSSAARFLFLGGIALMVSAVMTAYAKAVNELRRLIVANTVGAVVTLTLLPVLVYVDGIRGAAIASLTAYAVVAVVLTAGVVRPGGKESYVAKHRRR